MDQNEVEQVANEVITRPGFKKFVSGEIARQLKEAAKPKKETAGSKKNKEKETATT